MYKKALAIAMLGSIAAFGFGAQTPVSLISDGTAFEIKATGGTYAYGAGPFTGGGAVPISAYALGTKAGGTLDGTLNIGDVVPSLGIQGAVLNLTGTDIDGQKFKWDVSAPGLIGHPLLVNIGGFTISFTPSAVSGTLFGVAKQLNPPRYDVTNGVWRSVEFVNDPGQNSTISMSGTTAFGAGTVSLTNFEFYGLGGTPPAGVFPGGLHVSPTTVSGEKSKGSVTLNQAAGAGGVTVSVTTTSPAVFFDAAKTQQTANVNIAAGKIQGNFDVYGAEVTTNTLAKITASLDGVVNQVWVVVKPLLGSITSSTKTLTAGTGGTATVHLNGKAAADRVISIKPAVSYMSAPATVTVPAGQNSVSFNFTTRAIPGNVLTVVLRATDHTSAGDVTVFVPIKLTK